jgi:Uri superfamily endonuclease
MGLPQMQRGLYQLLIYLPQTTSIKVGRKGTFTFPKGYYVYTGSAGCGLKSRVQRHLRKQKKHFWHIDYLLDESSVKKTYLFPNSRLDECFLARRVLDEPAAEVVVPRFGSGDCNCPTHLALFKRLKDAPLNRLR